MKTASVFYPEKVLNRIHGNVRRFSWAKDIMDGYVQVAAPWMKMSEDDLWDAMFGHTLPRSWMVWSNGSCPDCKKSVPMYEWIIDPIDAPWKARCPHCSSMFPKNDFESFYKSGLDRTRVFDPAIADRTLLFNEEHPDTADPMHLYGVDDGGGYVDPVTGDRWRFIPAYLVFGQWKKFMLGGICALSNAFMVTGETIYARKAAIMLDRVADLYPSFDFLTEGEVYEKKGSNGYVSTWHDANIETKNMTLAYDMIYESIRYDPELPAFLTRKAEMTDSENRKRTFRDIAANIEDNILTEAMNHREKIHLNFPGIEVLVSVIKAVLQMEYKDDVYALSERAASTDGTTGEKGLSNYSSFTTNVFSDLLALLSAADDGFLSELAVQRPNILKSQRFFIDVRCLNKYYPLCGDTGVFTRTVPKHIGVVLKEESFTYLWRLWKLTEDDDLLRIIFEANGNSAELKTGDIALEDPEAIYRDVAKTVSRNGALIRQMSVDKKEWHIAILRSGKGASERVVWMKYDSTAGAHGHSDGMNLGMYAKGLDIMGDFGYPPVQFSGWDGIHFKWYYSTAAHNTVVIDRKNDRRINAGETKSWVPDGPVRAMVIDGTPVANATRFERSLFMIDIDDEDSYMIDVFRVAGGHDQAKFMHSGYASAAVSGANLAPVEEEFALNTMMRAFCSDKAPREGWSMDWKLEDRYGESTEQGIVGLKYTDFTYGAEAQTCEGWVSTGGFDKAREAWIPRAVVRRRLPEDSPNTITTTFAGVFEPYTDRPKIESARRLVIKGNELKDPGCGEVAFEIGLRGGRTDIFVFTDKALPVLIPEIGLRTDSEFCVIRKDASGNIGRIYIYKGSYVEISNRHYFSDNPEGMSEGRQAIEGA